MIKHKQLFRHRPEEGQIGDCARTTLACLLDLKPEEVPHFVKDAIERGNEFEALADMEAWLQLRGQSMIEFPISAESPEAAFKWAGCYLRNTYYLLAGTSRNDVTHVVIGFKDKLFWDTSIDNSGIIGPVSDGYYWIGMLITGFQGD